MDFKLPDIIRKYEQIYENKYLTMEYLGKKELLVIQYQEEFTLFDLLTHECAANAYDIWEYIQNKELLKNTKINNDVIEMYNSYKNYHCIGKTNSGDIGGTVWLNIKTGWISVTSHHVVPDGAFTTFNVAKNIKEFINFFYKYRELCRTQRAFRYYNCGFLNCFSLDFLDFNKPINFQLNKNMAIDIWIQNCIGTNRQSTTMNPYLFDEESELDMEKYSQIYLQTKKIVDCRKKERKFSWFILYRINQINNCLIELCLTYL